MFAFVPRAALPLAIRALVLRMNIRHAWPRRTATASPGTALSAGKTAHSLNNGLKLTRFPTRRFAVLPEAVHGPWPKPSGTIAERPTGKKALPEQEADAKDNSSHRERCQQAGKNEERGSEVFVMSINEFP
ncbi:hypothetical protein [Variovorax sp. PBL-E5]|uniref:hypothetical protein n=1 Tax=Variovorax sp. PBL-E5 TaxID=434014 RepID=UPI0013A560B9|nr:hypothetical protein [Variovorax sp. PBL-E5]